MQPDAIYLSESKPEGRIAGFTWREAGDEARRVAAWLRTQALPAKSAIAIMGKNSAHWIIADNAMWLAGHVAVPL